MSDANLAFSLTMDVKGFQDALDKCRQGLDKTTEAAKAAGKSMSFADVAAGAAAIATGFGAATVALDILKGGADMAKNAISGVMSGLWDCAKAASAIEQVATKMKVFTKSIKEANYAAEVIDRFAESPPFGLEETTAAAKALFATGTAVKNLEQELTVIGNVAAAGGMSIAQFGNKMAVACEMGTISMRELREMMQGGIPIMTSLAKVIGLTPDALKKALGEGRVTFANFKAALNDLGGTGGKFSSAMAEFGETFEGKIIMIQEQWENVKEAIGAPLINGLKPLLDWTIFKLKALGEITKGIMDIMQSASEKGNLGDLIGISLLLGFKTAINYGINGVIWIGKALSGAVGQALDALNHAMGSSGSNPLFLAATAASKILMRTTEQMGAELRVAFVKLTPVFTAIVSTAINEARGMLGFGKQDNTFMDYLNAASVNPDIVHAGDELPAQRAQYKEDLATYAKDFGKGMDGMTKAATEVAKKLLKEGVKLPEMGDTDWTGAWETRGEWEDKARKNNPNGYDNFMAGTEKFLGVIPAGADSVEGFTDSAKKAKTELSGANGKLAPAAEKAAKKLKDLSDITEKLARAQALAAGNYKNAAIAETKEKIKAKAKEYEATGMSAKDAQRAAKRDLVIDARAAKKAAQNPGAWERAQAREQRLISKGIFREDDSASKIPRGIMQRSIGRGAIKGPKEDPLKNAPGQSALRGKTEDKSPQTMLDTVRAIRAELSTIKDGLLKITTA